MQPNTERSLKKIKLRLGRRFTFQHDNDLEHSDKTKLEWLRDKSLTVLEWSSQSPDFRPQDGRLQKFPIQSDEALEDLPGRMG